MNFALLWEVNITGLKELFNMRKQSFWTDYFGAHAILINNSLPSNIRVSSVKSFLEKRTERTLLKTISLVKASDMQDVIGDI